MATAPAPEPLGNSARPQPALAARRSQRLALGFGAAAWGRATPATFLLLMFQRYLLAPLTALFLLAAAPHFAQAQTTGSVGIGTTAPDASAALDIVSTSKGLLLPRLTLAQRTALTNSPTAPPVPGLVIYQTDNTPGLYAYDGTGWVRLGADNLGNHTATQNLNLGANQLVGNGGTSGLRVSSAGSVSIGTATTAPTSTLQVSGSLAVGVALGVPGTTSGTPLGNYAATYFILNPTLGSDFYRLPSAVTCPGRVYYLRNLGNRSAFIGVTGQDEIFTGASSNSVLRFEMMIAGGSKTVTAISDGFYWTFILSGS